MKRRLALAAVLALSCTRQDDAPQTERSAGSDLSIVRLAPPALERTGIRTAPVDEGVVDVVFELPAEVAIHPDRVAAVSMHVDAHVAELLAGPHDEVDEGQVLARLHSVTIGSARAELRRVQANLTTAKANLERKRALHAEGIASKRAVELAEAEVATAKVNKKAAQDRLRLYAAKGKGLTTAEIRAPIAGEIIERHVSLGEVVHEHSKLFTIADLSMVRIEATIYERDLGRVVENQKATLSLVSAPGRVFQGTITQISSVIDPETRAGRVVVDMPNPHGLLRPGVTGVLGLVDRSQGPPQRTAVVPRDAVQEVDDRHYVFRSGEEIGEFIPTVVVVGAEHEGRVAILEGVRPGDPIAISGTFVLRSEMLRDRVSG